MRRRTSTPVARFVRFTRVVVCRLAMALRRPVDADRGPGVTLPVLLAAVNTRRPDRPLLTNGRVRGLSLNRLSAKKTVEGLENPNREPNPNPDLCPKPDP